MLEIQFCKKISLLKIPLFFETKSDFDDALKVKMKNSTFPCSPEQSFLDSLHGQERNAICKANRESESMHPLSERDRVKKDYGKVELKYRMFCKDY